MTNAKRTPLGVGRKLLFAAIVCLAPLALIEGALRAAGVERRAETDSFVELLASEAIDRSIVLLPGSPLFWAPRPGSVVEKIHVVNQDGFRGMSLDERLPAGPPPAGKRRILCLGDSTTFGWRIPQTQDTWPMQLQQILGDRYEVLNLGRPGYTSFQGRFLATEYAPKLRADLIVVAYGLNDCFESRLPDSARWGRFGHNREIARLSARLSRLRVFSLARRLALSQPAAGGCRVPLPEFRENLRAIASAAPRSLFLTEPVSRCVYKECYEKNFAESHPPYNDAVRRLGMLGELHVLDVDRAFTQCGDPCVVGAFPFRFENGVIVGGDPIHPNERGARLIAGLVSVAVKEAFGE